MGSKKGPVESRAFDKVGRYVPARHPFFRTGAPSFLCTDAAALSASNRATCFGLTGATPALFDATRLPVLLVILMICCLVMTNLFVDTISPLTSRTQSELN